MDRILVASSNDKATAMLVSLLKETFPTFYSRNWS